MQFDVLEKYQHQRLLKQERDEVACASEYVDIEVSVQVSGCPFLSGAVLDVCKVCKKTPVVLAAIFDDM